MNLLLWILRAPLAAQFPLWFRLFFGVAELCAGVGLILLGVTRILPQLVPLAALGIMAVTISVLETRFGAGMQVTFKTPISTSGK